MSWWVCFGIGLRCHRRVATMILLKKDRDKEVFYKNLSGQEGLTLTIRLKLLWKQETNFKENSLDFLANSYSKASLQSKFRSTFGNQNNRETVTRYWTIDLLWFWKCILCYMWSGLAADRQLWLQICQSSYLLSRNKFIYKIFYGEATQHYWKTSLQMFRGKFLEKFQTYFRTF